MGKYGTFDRTIKDDSPVAYYRCADDPATLILADSSGNARNGTLYFGGNPNSITDSQTSSMNVQYDDNFSLLTDGIEGELISSTNAALIFAANTAYTIEFAFKLVGTLNVLCRDDTTANGHIALFASGGFIACRSGTVTNLSAKASNFYNDSKWHYCQFVRRGTTAPTNELYVDGEKIIDAATGTAAVTTKWHLGRNGSGGSFTNAYFDEWSFYNTALSTTRLTAHLTAWETLPSPSPLMTGIG